LVKDEYTFDFLELGNDYSERQLENAISVKIDAFLKEMGGVFAFIGRQFKVEVGSKEYFIDFCFELTANVLQLQEVGDFGDENCLPPLNLIRSTKLPLTTEPPISCRCCYSMLLFLFVIFCFSILVLTCHN
jgi:hypothetical protein